MRRCCWRCPQLSGCGAVARRCWPNCKPMHLRWKPGIAPEAVSTAGFASAVTPLQATARALCPGRYIVPGPGTAAAAAGRAAPTPARAARFAPAHPDGAAPPCGQPGAHGLQHLGPVARLAARWGGAAAGRCGLARAGLCLWRCPPHAHLAGAARNLCPGGRAARAGHLGRCAAVVGPRLAASAAGLAAGAPAGRAGAGTGLAPRPAQGRRQARAPLAGAARAHRPAHAGPGPPAPPAGRAPGPHAAGRARQPDCPARPANRAHAPGQRQPAAPRRRGGPQCRRPRPQ